MKSIGIAYLPKTQVLIIPQGTVKGVSHFTKPSASKSLRHSEFCDCSISVL